MYCESCLVAFKSHGELVAHKRQATRCRPPAPEDSIPEGICNTKMNELKSRKEMLGHGEREKWMRIWEILFPESPPPDSPCQLQPVCPQYVWSEGI